MKAPVAVEPVPYWWFHGEVEAGGRFFLNNPQRNGSAYLGQPSLAKFYEYRDLRPGPFGNIWLSTGSSDGLYQIDVGGKNIGYNDQSYYLDASKAGQHYFNFSWDETPHVYSTSAQTIFSGVGTAALTPTCGRNLTAGSLAAQGALINPCLTLTDIGIRRDTASVEYRWTPTDAWDIKADYSHMSRNGTQVDGFTGLGVQGGNPSTQNAMQVPKPVDDTTQNYGLNGEYAGTSPWGKKFTFKVGYNGSHYTDNLSSYTIATPFAAGGANNGSTIDQMSLWPSNQANAFNSTVAADLPWKSRYVGTLSYTMMTQNDPFMPMTANPLALPAVNVLPASSLNGAINTLLSNNVVTTKLTPELTSKLSYRYYNYQNDTPQILFAPAGCQTAPVHCWTAEDAASAGENAIRSLSISYIKQNAGADLNWRPTREWNLGAAYGFERYNYTQADVDVTNENSGKVYADWKPTSWLGFRSSGYYSNRRYDTYDYLDNVAFIQFPNRLASDSWFYSSAYRQLMYDNRQRWKANFAVDIVVLPRVTVTPTFKYQDDNYGVNPQNQSGLQDSRSWSGGADVVYVINPDTSIMVGYLREYYTQLLYGGVTNTGTQFATNLTNDRTIVDTFTAAVRYAVIPSKLDTELRYTASHGVDNYQLALFNGANPGCGTGVPAGTNCQFPDNSTWFQRLDATAVYTFDKTAVAQAGLQGVVKAKLHYVWERNAVANWANDPVAPFNNPGMLPQMFMAGDNPNYNVHLLMASLAYTW